MKKIVLICTVAFTGVSLAQQNTLPTNGNIGIGTTSPSEKLDVNGKAIIDSTLTVKGNIKANSNIDVSNQLKVEGNVKFPGLGTAPGILSNKHFVVMDPGGDLQKSDFDVLRTELYAEKECSQTYLDNPYWMSGINKLFTSCPEMRVGIRTSTPEFALDVRGTGFFSGGIKLGATNVLSNPAFVEGLVTTGNLRPWIRLSNWQNGQNKTAFLVENNGNVFCTALRVRYTDDIPVPDYVFKPEYCLMPLSEVKEFVETNSHLPNIPSEDEIKENGLSIEQMQLKLLEKVEELTLYVIELEEQRLGQAKKLLELQAEINALKKETNQKN